MGNILTVPGAFEREKKVSAFKTISFLVSSLEIEPVTNFSDSLSGYEGDQANEPGPGGDRYYMENDQRKNPGFLKDEDTFPQGLCTRDVTFVTISYPSLGEKTLPASSPPGDSCRDIPPTKNDCVDYPGRSVLYSRQFRPLNRIISTEYKKQQSGEP